MEVVPVTDQGEVRSLYDEVRKQMQDGARSVQRTLGFQGGAVKDLTLYWRDSDAIWSHFNSELEKNRYWCCFGTEDPFKVRSPSITVEINPPFSGIDRRIAGCFVQEHRGNVFVAHSGKLGGGRKGIGQAAFRAFSPDLTLADVQWPDGQQSTTIIVATVGENALPYDVATFVREVDRFKTSVIGR